jgi:hypothetical protein
MDFTQVHQDSQTGVNVVKLISQNIYARTKVKSTTREC